ncbi:MAG: hypothetical protein Q8K79_22410 [Solirubrobacteraceae bacterium]|nr:hypothetical protein [Solirubrobacteraceae bacterium]
MPEQSINALHVVAEAVRAVVERDDERLSALAADAADLYLWTRDHGLYGEVELVIPPGAPSDWNIDWIDRHDGSKHVAVPMWTQQEGRSDLTLELELHVDEAGRWQARVLDLHVL